MGPKPKARAETTHMALPTAPMDVTPDLSDILRSAVAHGASDVHIRAGAPPLMRVNGELWPLDLPVLTAEASEHVVQSALPGDQERTAFAKDHECDFALDMPGIGRFRANAYRARGSASMVMASAGQTASQSLQAMQRSSPFG